MIIKVKCNKCGNLLTIRVMEENRNKAAKAKIWLPGKVCCGNIGFKCKD